MRQTKFFSSTSVHFAVSGLVTLPAVTLGLLLSLWSGAQTTPADVFAWVLLIGAGICVGVSIWKSIRMIGAKDSLGLVFLCGNCAYVLALAFVVVLKCARALM
jgi:hypothetical protein